MNRTMLTPLAAVAAAAALLATEPSAGAASHRAQKHHARHHAKRHHKRRRKASKAAATTAPATRTQTTCSTSPSLAAGTADPFEQHLFAAHLERSPAQQVQDAGDVSTYVAVHTALVQAMAQPSLAWGDQATTVLQQALAPFEAHLYAAHLDQSPTQQAAALMDPSTYTLNHTALVGQMLQPVLDYVQSALAGSRTCSTTTSTSEQPASPKSVSISGHMFMPQEVSVPSGTQITWTNQDSDPHNVVADGGAFKSKTLAQGESYSYTFSSPGTFTYSCSIHPDMKGKVTVG